MPDDTNTHLTADTYNRLFVPSLIPQDIKKIIHLDIDTVVVGDLAKLFSVDTGTCPAAAVPDAGMYLRTDLDIHSIDGYFNAGVMLLNLDEWKKQRVSERTIDVIVNQAERIKRYVDQDALNLVLNNNWYKLERKFNLMGMYSPKDLGVADQDNYLEDIVVIHFNGPKPWNLLGDCDHRFGYLYHFYKGKSPVKGEKKYMDVSFSKDFLKRYSYAKIMKLYFANPLIGKIWRKIKTT
jgi:lipopolysaccharide biosynthesis glycosyltransferase